MSLSGNLGFVTIDEVLRLLTRSKQQGSVNVSGNGLHGRVFVGKGGVDLATTSDNDELHRHLVNSGYADEKTLSRLTMGETTLAAIADGNQAIIDLLREMTVESLYQMSSKGSDFQVYEGATTPYASPKSFDIEALLQDTDERKREWALVSEVVPDLNTALRFQRDLGDRDEVAIKTDDWKVLSEIGAGSSVTEIADHLGTTEFWTARVAARLVKNELVVLEETEVEYDEPSDVIDEQPDDAYLGQPDPYSYDPETVEPASEVEEEAPVFQSEVASDDDDIDPDQSWWQEPKDEEEDRLADNETRTPEVVSENLSEMPTVGPSGENADDVEDAEDAEAEEDTEAFLQKVFSELESSEGDSEEGHGLLRRRRMGTLRDFSSDS